MIKHSTSHGLSVLVCTIVSAFIVELLKPLFPDLVEKTKNFTMPFLDTLRIPIDPDYFNVLMLTVILAMVWGVFFKLRFDK